MEGKLKKLYYFSTHCWELGNNGAIFVNVSLPLFSPTFFSRFFFEYYCITIQLYKYLNVFSHVFLFMYIYFSIIR